MSSERERTLASPTQIANEMVIAIVEPQIQSGRHRCHKVSSAVKQPTPEKLVVALGRGCEVGREGSAPWTKFTPKREGARALESIVVLAACRKLSLALAQVFFGD